MADEEEDVPIRVDFRDPAAARAWVEVAERSGHVRRDRHAASGARDAAQTPRDPLFERARTLLVPGRLLLYCDGYLHAETKLPGLSFERDEQPRALERAGFVDVRRLRDEGNLALYCATNPTESEETRVDS